jgi:hypothetical protein
MASPSMDSDVLVNALPYIDQGYDDPGVREAVSFKLLFSFAS